MTYGKAGRRRNISNTLLPDEKIRNEDIRTNDLQHSTEIDQRITTRGRTGVARGRISYVRSLRNSSKDPTDNPLSAKSSQPSIALFSRPTFSGVHSAGTKRDYSGKEIYESSTSDDELESLPDSAKWTTVKKQKFPSRHTQDVEGATCDKIGYKPDATNQACATVALLGRPWSLQDTGPGSKECFLGGPQRSSGNRLRQLLQVKDRDSPRTKIHKANSTESTSWKSDSTFQQTHLLQYQNKLAATTLECATEPPVVVSCGTESESATKNNSTRHVSIQQASTFSDRDLTSSYVPSLGTAECRNQPSANTRLMDRLQGDSSKGNGSADHGEDSKISSSRVSTESFTEPSTISSIALSSRNTLKQNSSQKVIRPNTKLSSAAPKITYARQRSYLIEALTDREIMLDLSVSDHFPDGLLSGRDEGGAGFRSAKSLPNPNDYTAGFEDTQNGAIRSIHELREAGSNARVICEAEAILDSIDRSSISPISIQCSAILQLARRLRYRTFCRHFVNHGLENRLLKYAKLCLNPIVSALLLTAFLHMVSCPCQRDTLSEFGGEDIFEFLALQLEGTDDLISTVRSRAHVVSRATQLDIEEYFEKLLTSNIWGPHRPSHIRARTLSLLCLDYIIRNLRRAGARYEIITRTLLERLVDVLLPPGDVPILAPDPNLALDIKLALSTLEWFTTASSSAEIDFGSLWTVQTLRRIAELLPRVLAWSGSPTQNVRTLALQVSVNLTNENQVVCSTFSQSNIIQACLSIVACNFDPVYVEPAGEYRGMFLNDLVLSLGVLINLAEGSETVRGIFLDLTAERVQPVCMLVRLFNTKAQCPFQV